MIGLPARIMQVSGSADRAFATAEAALLRHHWTVRKRVTDVSALYECGSSIGRLTSGSGLDVLPGALGRFFSHDYATLSVSDGGDPGTSVVTMAVSRGSSQSAEFPAALSDLIASFTEAGVLISAGSDIPARTLPADSFCSPANIARLLAD
ncbi:hypothetical protein [Leifsonia sp. Leaf264]|uniref:hypothetical protein n=1 Tax=Leifsonia sp. Leaf264 TaxID=1736314 RepID=UPI000AE2D0CB|nr:hypothetical protein [Leifsonia sp. Leaf264]